MTSTEVRCFLVAHNPSLSDDRTLWIEQNNIDGELFNALNEDEMKHLSPNEMSSLDLKRISRYQIRKEPKLTAKEMLESFTVSASIILNNICDCEFPLLTLYNILYYFKDCLGTWVCSIREKMENWRGTRN